MTPVPARGRTGTGGNNTSQLLARVDRRLLAQCSMCVHRLHQVGAHMNNYEDYDRR